MDRSPVLPVLVNLGGRNDNVDDMVGDRNVVVVVRKAETAYDVNVMKTRAHIILLVL